MQAVDPIDLVETLPEGLLLVDPGLSVRFANRAYYRMFGADEARTVGAPLFELAQNLWDLPGLRARLLGLLDGAPAIQGLEVECDVPGIGRRIFHIYARRVRRGRGETGHLLIAFDDVTESVRFERALERERVLARGIVDAIGDPLLVLDDELRVVTASRSFHLAFGTSEIAVEGRPLGEIGGGDWDVPPLRDLLREVVVDGAVVEGREIELDLSGRGTRRLEISARETAVSAGERRAILLVLRDLTEYRELLESQRLLIDELNHRVRNMLTVVKSIAAQTRRRSGSLDDFATAFDGRLQALASIHTLLADSKWAGTTLATLIRRQIQPYAPCAAAFTLRGPDLTVVPRSAVTLSLVFHELAVNAAKYGGLSRPTGRVDVTWAVAGKGNDSVVTLDWVESGVPVASRPARTGFGTDLIDFNIVHEFGGDVSRDFRPEGLACRLTIPWPWPARSPAAAGAEPSR